MFPVRASGRVQPSQIVWAKPVCGLFPSGTTRSLPPLPLVWANGLLLEVDVAKVGAVDGLPAVEPRRVDELQERPVTNRQRLVAGDTWSRTVSISSAFAASGSRRARRGPELSVGNPSRPEREAQERPDGRELPGDRRPGELPRVASGPARRRALPM